MNGTTTSGKTAESFVEDLKTLIADNMAGNARLVTRVNDLLREATRQASEGRGPGATSDPSALITKWLEFNIASYAVVSSQSLQLLNGLVNAAERTLLGSEAAVVQSPPPAPSPTPAATGDATGPLELRVEGRVGDTVRAPFLVENAYERALDVSFEAEPLVPTSGVAVAAKHISFEPDHVTIPPKGQAVVQAAVDISAAFTPGETYRTTLRLIGFHAKTVRLAVTVKPPVPDASAPGESADPKAGTRAARPRSRRSS
jgi:hypothetical protein